MNDHATAPDAVPGQAADGQPAPDMIDERVLAEIRAIQACSRDGGPVWFHLMSLMERSALCSNQVLAALKRLKASGHVLSEVAYPGSNRTRLEYVLTEACDSDTLRALKERDWRHPVFARPAFEG